GQVQTHDSVRVVAFEATAQELQEHGVESEPGAFFVDVPEKQVAVLGVLEHRLAAYVTGQLGGETSADAVRDGDGEQKFVHRRFEGGQDVVGEDVADRVVPAGGVLDEPGRIGAVAQRQRRQLQHGGPAFGGAVEIVHVLGFEIDTAHVAKKRVGF